MVTEAIRKDFGRVEIYGALKVKMCSLNLKTEGHWKKTEMQARAIVRVLENTFKILK